MVKMLSLKTDNLFSRVSRLVSRVVRHQAPFTFHPSPFTFHLSPFTALHLSPPRRGFTLMEVNLAIFIMAVGLLAMVALYPLAYRESRQSKDDVKAAAAADCVLNTLTAALSSRNIEWKDWVDGIDEAYGKTDKGKHLKGGWLAYCDEVRDSNTHQATFAPKKHSQINSLAKQVFGALAGINREHKPSWPVDDELACAIVVQWGQMPVFDGDGMQMMDDRSRVTISLRITRRVGDLLGQPVFYTEVHFQGDQKELKE